MLVSKFCDTNMFSIWLLPPPPKSPIICSHLLVYKLWPGSYHSPFRWILVHVCFHDYCAVSQLPSLPSFIFCHLQFLRKIKDKNQFKICVELRLLYLDSLWACGICPWMKLILWPVLAVINRCHFTVQVHRTYTMEVILKAHLTVQEGQDAHNSALPYAEVLSMPA